MRPNFGSKVAAIYMSEPGSSGSTPPALVYDSDSDRTIAESATWAGARKGNDKPKLGHCVACGEDVEFYKVARVPCEHEYCRPCLAQLFELSMTDETLFPPRCDKQEIPLSRVRFFLPADLSKRFEATYVELSTKNRVYWYDPRCNTFIPATAVNQDNDVASCSHCDRTTCAVCKGPSHSGDCPNDTALQQLVTIADTEQWQRCYQCKRFAELEMGCNHMTCACDAHFCYVCGLQWRTCQCPQWDEPRLLDRATRLVDRNANPRRRLFEPQRVMHVQPASRRGSDVSSAATAASPATRRSLRVADMASPATSAWQSDFEDRSEWEHDWADGGSEDDTDDQVDEPPPVTPAAATPTPAEMPVMPAVDTSSRLRARRIAEAVEHLRHNHELPSAGVQSMQKEQAVR
ncbi:hypothetical protein LTR56_027625 [Elasticomyces elasticus]|nr:hypothetical protein LTR56_027625 [Elasticomyces elasticus]KAK3614581.1 hypothetical protein LTR22_027730 [Elasticomyces elasticus]